jgi:hypothetical protein
MGRILKSWAARVLGVSNKDLSIRRGEFHAVTIVHAALSLPPRKLAELKLRQRHNKLLSQLLSRIEPEGCKDRRIVVFRANPYQQFY